MKRICDNCRNFEVSMDNTMETCHAKKDGSKVIRWITDNYADERISGDKTFCKGHKAIAQMI